MPTECRPSQFPAVSPAPDCQSVCKSPDHGLAKQCCWRLRNDSRVEVREGVNARYLTPVEFTTQFDLVVMDVSFISVTKVLPAIVPLLTNAGRVITLIKPQFEVGRGEVGSGGIVRDPQKHERVIAEVTQAATGLGLRSAGVIESPIQGADGNREFLSLFDRVQT